MTDALKIRTCANHPERTAQALCVECAKPVCQECATRWDGINYCVICLEKIRDRAAGKSSSVQWGLLLGAVVLLFFAANAVLVWFGANFHFLF